MAVQDNLDSVFNEPAIGSEFDRVESRLVEFVSNVEKAAKKVNAIEIKLGGNVTLGELKNIQAEADKITKEAAANTKKLADSYLQLSKAQKEAANATIAETKNTILLTKEKERLDKAMAKEEASLKKQNNAYEQAKKQYSALANEAKRLAFELGVDDAKFKAAAASAHAMHTQLLTVEMAVGQAQRQVGNYNIVGAQFNQLLREAPNAGLGMRTFVMAISNNITYFAEAVQQAKKEGQSWGAILGTMGKSLFSVVGIINIAVTALTFITMAMTKASSETKELENNTDSLTESLGRNIEALQKQIDLRSETNKRLTKSEGALKREIDLLKARGATDEEIFAAEQRFYARRIENNRNQLNSINDVIARTSQLFKFYEQQGFKASVVQEKVAAELTNTIKEVTETTLEESRKQADAVVASYVKNNGKIKGLEMRRGEITKETNDLISESNIKTVEFQIKMNEEISKADEELAKKDKKLYEEMMKARKKALEDWRKAETEDAKAQFEVQKAAVEFEIETQQAILDNEKSTNEEKYAALDKITELKTRLATETANFEAMTGSKSAAQITAIYQLLETNLTKIRQKGLDDEADISLASLDNERKTAAEREKMQKDNAARVVANAKKSEEIDKKEMAAKMQALQQYVQAVQQAAAIYSRLADEKTKRELEGLDREQEEVQNTEERERARAERTITDKAKLESAISDIEGKADAKRIEIEDRRKEAEKKQAQRTKELAILNVVANMVIGISKEIAGKGVAGLATSAAIGIYIAGLTGIIAALAVPAYAEGTGNHPGGLARVGDGGEHELVNLPGGKSFISPNTDTLMNLPKGTEVIPMPDLKPGLITPEAMNIVMLQGGGDNKKTEQLLEQLIAAVENSSNGKPHPKTWERDGLSHQSIQKGNNRYDYLRKGWYD